MDTDARGFPLGDLRVSDTERDRALRLRGRLTRSFGMVATAAVAALAVLAAHTHAGTASTASSASSSTVMSSSATATS